MKKTILSIISTLVVCGCSFSQDALYPSLFGSNEEAVEIKETPSTQVATQPTTTAPAVKFEPKKIETPKNTGTLVGQKVMSFTKDLQSVQKSISQNNAELQKVRKDIVLNSAQYHKTLAAIESKLQVGTTPGNPDVYAMLNSIQSNIQTMDNNALALEQLSRKVTADSDLTASLLDSIRSTFVISGAVDEDHRQLRILENEAAQNSILIQSLLSEINSDALRQTQYSQTAKNYINELAKAVRVGSFVGSQEQLPSYQAPMKGMMPTEYNGASSPALMSINFSNSNPEYKDTLKSTVSEVLSKRPNATFDVVSLNSATPNNANKVFQEMVNAGIDANSINVFAINDGSSGPEVEIFVK